MTSIDAVPAMCDRCGTVRDYVGAQPDHAFIACCECGRKVRHTLVVGSEPDHGLSDKERADARALLRVRSALSLCGFTFARRDRFPIAGWCAGAVLITDTDGVGDDAPRGLFVFLHPDTTDAQERAALLKLYGYWLARGMGPAHGWIQLPTTALGRKEVGR